MKKVLVTGGSRGIGFETAKMLKNVGGYDVYTPTRNELDLSDLSCVEKFCKVHSEETFDVLINNAGINDIHNIDEITDSELFEMMNINLIAPTMLIRGIVPNMKKQRYGRIVNIGSIWGLVGKPGRTVYSATKHGIHGVTQTLAVELAPYNILINTVCPGFTMTELTKKNNDESTIKEIISQIPIGRMAEPEEQAKVICYLASSYNTYITGQQLAVDGGYTAK